MIAEFRCDWILASFSKGEWEKPPSLLGNYDRPTNQPPDRPTDQQTNRPTVGQSRSLKLVIKIIFTKNHADQIIYTSVVTSCCFYDEIKLFWRSSIVFWRNSAYFERLLSQREPRFKPFICVCWFNGQYWGPG